MALGLAVSSLLAYEHHGVVKSGGIPVPGATVTVTQGDKKLVTTTDDQGLYSFPNLGEGVWVLQIQILGFATLTRDVGIAPDAPVPVWDLQLLSLTALQESLAPAAPAPAPAGTPPTPASPATSPAASATPAANTPAQNKSVSASASVGGRGGTAGGNSRPSLRQAAAQSGFQRMDVNATGDGLNADAGMGADANASGDSSDALMANGSVSSALGMPQQNDWGGPGGPGGMNGFGPGGMNGMNTPGGGAGMNANPMDGGGPGGGPGGRGGGAMAGGGGFGGRGGGGFGGRGGRGGRQGGRGGNQNSFGNGRRDARMRLNGNIAVQLDNSVFDAQNFSLSGQPTPKPGYNKLHSTGMIGGPLKIPHVLSGRNTAFTFNYQLTRQRSSSVSTTLVPTEAERSGDFAGLASSTGAPITLINPNSTGPAIVNNVIPASAISPQALAFLNYYPLPNSTGTYNYQAPLVGITNQTNINTRVSQTINAKNQINGRFAWQHNDTTNPNLFNFIDATKMTGINSSLSWIYHFTTRVINTATYSFSRSATNTLPYFYGKADVSAALGIQGNDQASYFNGPPSLSFSSGFAGFSDANYSLNHNNTNAASDSLLWVHGVHNITFGADYRRLDFNAFSQSNPRGSFSFTGALSGYDFADFLLGYPDTESIAYGNPDKYFRASWLDGYVTDDWRLSSRLTLNVGVRWDFQAPVTELQNRLVNPDVSQNFVSETPVCGEIAALLPGQTCQLASSAGLPSSLVRPNYHEFQPRLGFAWKPFAKHSTVVRGGYGIYFNTSVYQPLASSMAQQAPISTSLSQANSTATLFDLATGLKDTLTSSTAQTFALDPDFRIGYVHYWQMLVQQNLPDALVLTVIYNGNKGTHLMQEFLPNTVPTGAIASVYPSGYAYETSGANSEYEMGSVQLQRRFRSGFLGNVIYTHSKAIDDSQAVGGRGAGGFGNSPYAQNWLDPDAERSLSSFNRANTLNLTLQYSTGMGNRGGALVSGFKGALLKDWTVGPSLTLGSGLPLTPIVSSRVATGSGITGTTRAEYLGLPLSAEQPGYYFNTAAFGAPPSGEWGDAGRGIITGPVQFAVNASAGRVFRIGERRSIDLRFDATNVLNHVAWAAYNTTYGNAQFGLPTAANAMRAMTATLRFRF
ncbi:MAG: carboxypeptidase regulatory-like domain-containing protein [Bryobacteraceae bacterium]